MAEAARDVVAEAAEVIYRISQAGADGVYDAAECRGLERALADFDEMAAPLRRAMRAGKAATPAQRKGKAPFPGKAPSSGKIP